MTKDSNEKRALKVTWGTIIVNILLTAFKFAAGLLASSAAMVSDAVEGLTDILSSLFVIVGIRASAKERDSDHPYGHERLECVAAIIMAALIAATGIGIGYKGLALIVSGGRESIPAPGLLALIAAAVTIAVKEAMFWYVRGAAKKLGSPALMASAWHHRSDALSSVGSFAGILGARLAFPVLDPIAATVICFFIVKSAYDIFKEAIGGMTDRSCDSETVEKIKSLTLAQEGVLGLDDIKTRRFGSKIYVDIEISADPGLTLVDAHEISERVHREIERSFPSCKHCMVHVNPHAYPEDKNSGAPASENSFEVRPDEDSTTAYF